MAATLWHHSYVEDLACFIWSFGALPVMNRARAKPCGVILRSWQAGTPASAGNCVAVVRTWAGPWGSSVAIRGSGPSDATAARSVVPALSITPAGQGSPKHLVAE